MPYLTLTYLPVRTLTPPPRPSNLNGTHIGQVVVSPLVSLMEDQMANLPPQLPGASLSGSHGGLREVAGTVRDLRAGRVKVIPRYDTMICLIFGQKKRHLLLRRDEKGVMQSNSGKNEGGSSATQRFC